MSDAPTFNVNRASRIAGFWYISLAIFGVFGILVADASFLAPGDAAATAALIQGNELLFRLGILSNLIGQACFLFLGIAFYRLFGGVNKGLAQTLLVLVLAAVPIAFLNAVFKFAALELLGGASYLSVFNPAQLQALTLLFSKLQENGVLIASVFWGLWLLPLGLLTWQSSFLPKVFGVLLIINGLSYLVDVFLGTVFPGIKTAVAPILTVFLAIGEVPFLLWLLLRGARVRSKEDKRNPRASNDHQRVTDL